jgi:hypothetical protein
MRQTSSEANNSPCSQKNIQNFMEHGGSLSCSQDFSTEPYPEPDESSPIYLTYILISSSNLSIDLLSNPFSSSNLDFAYIHMSHLFYMSCSSHPLSL